MCPLQNRINWKRTIVLSTPAVSIQYYLGAEVGSRHKSRFAWYKALCLVSKTAKLVSCSNNVCLLHVKIVFPALKVKSL